eukprot:GEMP01032936.1.p1 GENE.GEMP01032936.1~~GEMP01032936.1.p1  ORF type:complete len:531 (+),score=101.35 GEMP01032936.1:109-1701(+)
MRSDDVNVAIGLLNRLKRVRQQMESGSVDSSSSESYDIPDSWRKHTAEPVECHSTRTQTEPFTRLTFTSATQTASCALEEEGTVTRTSTCVPDALQISTEKEQNEKDINRGTGSANEPGATGPPFSHATSPRNTVQSSPYTPLLPSSKSHISLTVRTPDSYNFDTDGVDTPARFPSWLKPPRCVQECENQDVIAYINKLVQEIDFLRKIPQATQPTSLRMSPHPTTNTIFANVRPLNAFQVSHIQLPVRTLLSRGSPSHNQKRPPFSPSHNQKCPPFLPRALSISPVRTHPLITPIATATSPSRPGTTLFATPPVVTQSPMSLHTSPLLSVRSPVRVQQTAAAHPASQGISRLDGNSAMPLSGSPTSPVGLSSDAPSMSATARSRFDSTSSDVNPNTNLNPITSPHTITNPNANSNPNPIPPDRLDCAPPLRLLSPVGLRSISLKHGPGVLSPRTSRRRLSISPRMSMNMSTGKGTATSAVGGGGSDVRAQRAEVGGSVCARQQKTSSLRSSTAQTTAPKKKLAPARGAI